MVSNLHSPQHLYKAYPIRRPLWFASQKTSDAETRYTATDLECAGVLFALKKFKHYLLGKKFDLYTDHSALRFILKNAGIDNRHMRWVEKLSAYEFTIHHKPGKQNIFADALSHLPTVNSVQSVHNKTIPPKFQAIIRYLQDLEVPTNRNWKNATKKYALLNGMLYRRTASSLIPCIWSESERAEHSRSSWYQHPIYSYENKSMVAYFIHRC